MGVNKTRPVAAFLTEDEYRVFEAAAKKTGQETGQAAKFALMYWAKIVGGADEDSNCDGHQGKVR